MKIFHLISSEGLYGAEVMLLNLASEQKRLGAEPIIALFQNEHSQNLEMTEEAIRRGLTLELFTCRGRVDFLTVRSIREWLKNSNVDLVHAHGYKSDIYGYFSARPLEVPFLATCHCHLWTGASRLVRLYQLFDCRVLRRADRVVAVADSIANALVDSGVRRSRVSTIYNGTDLLRYAEGRPNLRSELGIGDRPLIGAVARLVKGKGLEYFVHAAKEIVREVPAATFVIVGDGPLRAQLEELIVSLGLQSRVRLLGRRTDMPAVYASLDVFVLASIDEGMPMTILEALAAKRPVVATRVGAVDKVVLSQQTGLLVAARSAPALQEAILRCLRDPYFSRGLAQKGFELVHGAFSAEAMARQYLDIYHDVLFKRETVARPSFREA